MKPCTIILTVFANALPAAVTAQTRAAADSMAAIESAQSSAGTNELAGLTIRELMGDR